MTHFIVSLISSVPPTQLSARVVRLGELLTTLDLAILVHGGGMQVDRWLCCLTTVITVDFTYYW